MKSSVLETEYIIIADLSYLPVLLIVGFTVLSISPCHRRGLTSIYF